MATPHLPTPLPQQAHRLSNGSLLLRTAHGPVLIDSETLAHIMDRHMPDGAVAGSRFYGAEDDLLVVLAQVADRADGLGAQPVALDRPVGTDAVRPLAELQAAGLADAVVPVRGQATDPTAAEYEPRAGALMLDRTRVPAGHAGKAAAQETQEAVVVFAAPPTGPDAFAGADAVLANWLMARIELALSDEEMARGRSVITAFPGRLTPRLPTDRFFSHPSATRTEEARTTLRAASTAFWDAHVFVADHPSVEAPVAGQVAVPELATLKGDYLRFAAAVRPTGSRARLTHVLEARRGAAQAARLLRARGVDVQALAADPIRAAFYRNRSIAAGRMAVDAPYWRQFLRQARETPRPALARVTDPSQARLLQICRTAEADQSTRPDAPRVGEARRPVPTVTPAPSSASPRPAARPVSTR